MLVRKLHPMNRHICIIKGRQYGKGICFKAYQISGCSNARPRFEPQPKRFATERQYAEAIDRYWDGLLGNF